MSNKRAPQIADVTAEVHADDAPTQQLRFGLAKVAIDFFEDEAVMCITRAMQTGGEPTPQELIELCKAVGGYRRRYLHFMPESDASGKHDFEE